MAARRQSSSTSLSKFARANSPDPSNRSLDFCNAFWGAGDGGVDVLFARMRGAARSAEELRAFWKERASIEEDYAKRLCKLAKAPLGRDEIGELKNSLDTLRSETDRQASAHANLAQQVHTELEIPAGALVARQTQFKRQAQSVIEKAFKNKQTQESYVAKAREKYEADCMRINSYTAQSTLVQGKDLEKIQLKLDRARQTVTANERDFANFARALQGTMEKWEKDWKAFCDACQDLEEERIEFMKDNAWAYANAVSTVCVSDDESCEKIRISLEQLEPERDMENFVRDYGTGSEIPDPPRFISYTNPEAASATSSRQPTRYASFPRASSRHMSMGEVLRAMPSNEEPTDAGLAGFGAGGSGPARNGDLERSNTTATQSRSATSSSPVNGTSGPTTPSTVPTSSQSRVQSQTAPSSAVSQPDPSASVQRTMLAVGPGVYEVYPDKDPQSAPGSAGNGPSNSRVGANDDPLARHMAELRSSAAATGSIRRNSVNAQRPSSGYQSASPAPNVTPSAAAAASSSLSGPGLTAPAPSVAQPANRDYRNSAEFVVGGPPPTSRPTSPAGPPTAAHMIPPAPLASSPLPVEQVLSRYSPALPGEHRNSISRGNSPGIESSHTHSQSLGQDINRRASILERPKSREGYAGIGSGGRSPSPGPAPGTSPGPSSNMYVNGNQNQSQNSYRIPSPAAGAGPDLGIELDASGRVMQDSLAEQYRAPQVPQAPQPQPPRGQYGPQRSMSVNMTSPVGLPSSQQPQYGAPGYTPQPPYVQQPPPPTSQGPSVQRQPSVWYHQQDQQQQQQQQPQPQPQPQQSLPPQPPYIPPPPHHQPPINSYPSAPNGANVHRGPSMNAHSNGLGYQNTGYHQNYGAPARRSPSPQPPPAIGVAPTGQYINGRPILFYVKALYDYQATIDEEFDFQSGDIIAVTSTPEDGWWTGELLDDSRRVPGRTVFPSNFVCLF